MTQQAQIMVIMGPGLERSPALLRALSLARRSGALLQLRSFEYEHALDHAASKGFDLQAYLQGRRERLEKLAQPLRHQGYRIECRIVWGRPFVEKIILEALALRPELVIKDVTHESVINRAFLSSLDWLLLARCPTSLMLVQPASPSLPRHILAAVDPLDEHGKAHDLNDGILDAATTLAGFCGAELDVVNSVDFIPMAGEEEYAGWMPDFSIYEEIRKVHAEGLYKLCKAHGVPPEHMHVLNGQAAAAITDFAGQQRADLVIMGSIHRAGLQHLLIGSTAEGVFDRLGCDLMLVKPAGFAAELRQALETGKSKAA